MAGWGVDQFVAVIVAVGVMGLAIWTVMAFQNRIIRARDRGRRGNRSGHVGRRPWQFSLRSLLVLTALFAGVCSLAKILPPGILAFVVFIVVVFLGTVLFLGAWVWAIWGLVTLIERGLERLAKKSPREDDGPQDGDGQGAGVP